MSENSNPEESEEAINQHLEGWYHERAHKHKVVLL